MFMKAVFIVFHDLFGVSAVSAQNPQATPPPNTQPTEPQTQPPTQPTNPAQQHPAPNESGSTDSRLARIRKLRALRRADRLPIRTP